MAPRGSSFGFLGMFGRSEDLRAIDAALRTVGLHKAVVPEGVKLALSNLMKNALGDEPPADSYRPAVLLLAYCMLGIDGFADANGEEALEEVGRRVGLALDRPNSLDAGIVLLAHHAGLLRPEVAERHGVEVATD